MTECIFCKIIAGELEAAKLWEDEHHVAILDAYPNTRGQALIITKQHKHSDLSAMSPHEYQAFFAAAQQVIDILKQGLQVHRVALVVEGLGIDHAHIKLYPLHGLEKPFQEMWSAERVFFDKYEGYISTQLGPQADFAELRELAQEVVKALQK